MASRAGFSNRLGFVAAAAGSAVGLGNIWAFPSETAQNGGGAFLFIYLFFVILIGFPIMVGEISLGRKTLANPYGAYNLAGNKNWALVGLFGVICGVMILSFYNVVAGWAFGYFVQIAFGNLLEVQDYGAHFGEYVSSIGDIFIYSLVFMALTGFIVVRGIQQGIETAAKLLMPFLFAILIGLIIYSLTLDNAMDGVAYYLLPDFSKINLGVINSALGQAFFSLSLGMGALITYGSYISKKENITGAAAIVTAADTAVAFLAGLLIIPLLSSLNMQDTAGGPGLVFIVLPKVFATIGPVFGRVIGAGFFLLLSVAALTSTISLLEVPVSYLVDEKKWPRKRAVIVLASAIFLIGIPSMLSQGAVEWLGNFSYAGKQNSFLDLIQNIFLDIGLPFGGLMLCIFLRYKWKLSNLTSEIKEGNESYPNSWVETFIRIAVTYICPVLLAMILFSNLLNIFFGVS